MADQADSAISALSNLVLGVRDSCGGRAPSGVRDLIMWSSTPSYEAAKGYAVATGCWRGDSLPEGTVVALVRNAKNDTHGDIVQVWQLDGSTLRFRSGPAAGVQCRKQSWKF